MPAEGSTVTLRRVTAQGDASSGAQAGSSTRVSRRDEGDSHAPLITHRASAGSGGCRDQEPAVKAVGDTFWSKVTSRESPLPRPAWAPVSAATTLTMVGADGIPQVPPTVRVTGALGWDKPLAVRRDATLTWRC